ncbi:MAG: RsmE family RNA methyltransferase, partial [Bacilli bacterium]
MQRYFVDSRNDEYFLMSEEQAHHILRVMRMGVGDKITVCFNNEVYLCEITSTSPLLVKEIENLFEDHELTNNVTLFYCLPKGDKLDLVIQKASELGVSEIVLVQSKWCVCKFKKEDYPKKLERFNKIALEACEQSKRNKRVTISQIIDFKDIKNYHFDHKFIAYEKEEDSSFFEKLSSIKKGESIAVLVGSEGGFAKEEVEYAKENGFYSISLGKRILRSE